MNWGYYKFTFAPTVDLQYAFFNGVGWESWENVWGFWNGVSPREGEATRRIAAIERAVAGQRGLDHCQRNDYTVAGRAFAA